MDALYAGLEHVLSARGRQAGARSNLVCAAMPGLVVSVAVAPGDPVAPGQALVVLEAMKMQNPVRAPRAGRVGQVLVAAGTQVESGAPLLELTDAEARRD